MTTILARKIFPLLWVLICVSPAWSQWTKEVAQRGFISGTAFDISTLDSVDTVNGNVIIRIPIAALPAGRAGTGVKVALTYNSGIYDSVTNYLIYDSGGTPLYNVSSALIGASVGNSYGVWSYGFNYALSTEYRNAQPTAVSVGDSVGYYPDGCVREANGAIDMQNSTTSALYPRRMRAVFPDGSSHVLVLTNSTFYALSDGWSAVDSLTGQIVGCFQTGSPPPIPVAFPLHYVTIDGTYVRVTVTGQDPRGGAVWTMMFPDSKTVTGVDLTTDHIYDRNGNAVTISQPSAVAACYPLQGGSSNAITDIKDDFGRCIQVEHDLVFNGDWVTQAGAQGATLITKVNFASVAIDFTYGYDGGTCQFGYEGTCLPNANWGCAATGTCTPVYSPMVSGIDLTQAGFTTPLSYSFGYNHNDASCQTQAPYCYGQLTDVTLPHGSGVATAAPTLQYSFSPGSTLAPQDIPIVSKTLTHYDPYTGEKLTDTWTYTINTPAGGVNNSITNPGGSKTNYFAYDPYSTPLSGHTFKVETIDPSNNLLNRQEQMWAQNVAFGLPENIYLKAEFRSVIPSNATAPSLTAITQYSEDVNGNITRIDESDWVSYSALSHGSTYGDVIQVPPFTPVRSTANTFYVLADGSSNVANAYWSNTAPRILNATKSTQILDGGGITAAYSEFVYDDPTGAGNGPVGSGAANITQEWRWDSTRATFPGSATSGAGSRTLSASNAIEMVRTYALGDVLTETDPRGNQRQFQYNSSIHPYATDLYEANGSAVQQHWQLGWDAATGLRLSETDPNSANTTVGYDGRGRQTSMSQAGLRKTNTNYDDSVQAALAKRDLNNSGDGAVQERKLTDDLGKVWFVQSTDGSCPAGIQRISLQRTSASGGFTYQLSSNPYCTTSDPTMGWTRTKLDPLGRIVEVAHFTGSALPSPWGTNANSTGAATTSYNANLYTMADESGISRTMNMDGLNRLQSVLEAGTATTAYSYDVLNNLVAVNQGGFTTAGCSQNQFRCFGYTSLGRLKSATNPESGTTTYTYDDAGNLAIKADARAVSSTLSYDSLDRVVMKSYSDGTPAVTYCYDGQAATGTPGQCTGTLAAPFLGRMTQMVSSVSILSYTNYDLVGRILASTQTTNGVNFPFTYSYNMVDGLTRESYPSGRVVSYDYNVAGQADRVANGELSSQASYASNIGYAPHGALAGMTLGNGVAETWAYNPRLQATQMQAGSLLTIGYGYSSSSNNGNPMSQTTTRSGGSWTDSYSYDNFNRLASISESGTGGLSQTFGYDNAGNRWLASYPGLPAPTLEVPQTANWYLSNNTINGWSYDNAGNLLAIPNMPRSYTYDAESRQMTSSINGVAVNYAYDGEGKRVLKTVGTQTTIFVYDAMGRLAAESGGSNPSGTNYISVDALGSTRLTTDSSGNAIKCYDYLPFGEQLYAGLGNRPSNTCFDPAPSGGILYTGKERDSETGLDFFETRYFSGAQGRFTSPDGVFAGQHASNPQSWNMFSYALNNPMRFVDPNGDDPCEGGINPESGNICTVVTAADPGWFRSFFGAIGSFFKGSAEEATVNTAIDTFNMIETMRQMHFGNLTPGLDLTKQRIQPASNSEFLGQFAGMAASFFVPGGGEEEAGAKVIGRVINVLEESGGVVHVEVKAAQGAYEVMANVRREGTTLILDAAHIEGSGAGQFGPGMIRELREAARQFGREQGATEVVVNPGARTSGMTQMRSFRVVVNQ